MSFGETFHNQDLAMRFEKYLENGKIEFKDLVVTQLDENTVALDIYWGDERPFVEYDTYLYPIEKFAAGDGLTLYIKSLEDRYNKKYL
jgi:hypothetical protein